jgi:hypothetical protein
MSLSKKLTLFIGLMALGTTSAWAACTRLRTDGEINMAMGGWLLARLTSRIGDHCPNWTMPAPGDLATVYSRTTVLQRNCCCSPIWEIKFIPPMCPVLVCV